MKPLTVHHPFWLLGLVAGCLLTAGLGFWFVFHPLTSSTATQPKPAIQATQQSRVVQEIPKKPQTLITQKPTRSVVPPGTKQATVHGSDNTIVGNDHRSIEGNGNTIVGATDANGNTILNHRGTAIGSGATAGPTSIAIGAHANAGGTRQAIVDNEGGTIGSTTCVDCSVGGSPVPNSPNGSIVRNQGKIGRLDMHNVSVCNLNSWDSFLDCIDVETGDHQEINNTVDVMVSMMEQSLAAHPEAAFQSIEDCRGQIAKVKERILGNLDNEHETVSFLRLHRPSCMKETW